jgi:23S rRNA (pseudouridine1915-N3)-methyltransferase
MKIQIHTVSAGKKSPYSPVVDDLMKRINRFENIEMIQTRAIADADKRDRNEILKKETELLNKKLPDSGYLIALHDAAKHYTSENFSNKLRALQESSQQPVCFIIGSSYGLSNEILEKSNEQLSLSKMTLPHALAQVVLLEQIYRGFTLLNGIKYHK